MFDMLALLAQAPSAADAPVSSTVKIIGWSIITLLAALPFIGLIIYRKRETVHDPNPPFLRKYIFSVDHKIIGIQFLFTGILLFGIGGGLALVVRWQLAWPFDPSHPVPVVAEALKWPEAEVVKRLEGASSTLKPQDEKQRIVKGTVVGVKTQVPAKRMLIEIDVGGPKTETVGTELSTKVELDGKVKPEKGDVVTALVVKGRVMPANYYLTAMTMHASVMIFLVIIPMLVGVFGNFAVPLMIGAGDMAFPRLNMFTYWLMPLGAYIMLLGFLVGDTPPGKALEGGTAWAAAGWTSYPPLSVLADAAPGSGVGQSCWGLAVLVLGTSSILGAMNYITTIIKLRAPGMDMFRMPLTVWSVFITSLLALLSTPVLTAALILLVMDRVAGTSFFIPAGQTISGKAVDQTGGGQVLLFQHLFWFYSHPAVYLMILPAMGIASDVMSTFARKALFGYHAMIYSIASIAGLGFIVWGHHMFQSGMNPWLGMTFMVSTMMIALPSGVKVFNWLATLWRGNIRFEVPMLHALAFVALFIIGGLSGIYMAATPVDVHIHDTYFIVGHIHYVLFGGSTSGIFAGIVYWYPKMFGKKMNYWLGVVHFALTFIFMNWTFFTMHILGAAGMHRRIADPYRYEFIAHLHPMNFMMTMGALGLGVTQLLFLTNFIGSFFWGEKAGDNPWQSNTLEWQTSSPPPHGNFSKPLTVYRGAYEYGSDETKDDYIPQNLDTGKAAPAHH